MVTLKINGEDHMVDVSPDMPLLGAARRGGSDRHQVRLRAWRCAGPVRCTWTVCRHARV
jgi:hypothetical protein